MVLHLGFMLFEAILYVERKIWVFKVHVYVCKAYIISAKLVSFYEVNALTKHTVILQGLFYKPLL